MNRIELIEYEGDHLAVLTAKDLILGHDMKKIELLEHCNFYGLAVVEGGITDTFVYEVRGVTAYKCELTCMDRRYDEFGNCKNATSRLRSFKDFTDSDKVWLLRSCLNARHCIRHILRTCILDTHELDNPSLHLETCIIELSLHWTQLADVCNEMSTNSSIKNLTENQTKNYIKDQFNCRDIEKGDVLEWFKKGEAHGKLTRRLQW